MVRVAGQFRIYTAWLQFLNWRRWAPIDTLRIQASYSASLHRVMRKIMTLYSGPVSSQSQSAIATGISEVLQPIDYCAAPCPVGCKTNVVAFPDPAPVEPDRPGRYNLVSRRRRRWVRLEARH